MNRRGLKKQRKSQRGNTLVEFALCFPLMIGFVATVAQFGYAFFVYNSLQTAVRAGARYASTADFDSPNGEEFQQRVRNVVVYGVPNPEDQPPLVPGLTADDVAIDSGTKDGSGIPISVTVSVSDFELPALWLPMSFDGKPATTFVYLGQFL